MTDARSRNAIVLWAPPDEGGRRSPPSGEEPPIYSAVAKFMPCLCKEPSEPPADIAWSLAVQKVTSLFRGDQWLARVFFRVDDAPTQLLFNNHCFELYEGRKRVAVGVLFD